MTVWYFSSKRKKKKERKKKERKKERKTEEWETFKLYSAKFT